MKIRFAVVLGSSFLLNAALAETIQVPARANPWLAGMTNGSTARRSDSAPDESPVPVAATAILAGAAYSFSVTGSANHGAPCPFFPADGEDIIRHYLGAENGIADITAPFVSLIGVFLGPNQPNQSPVPPALDFRNEADRDYLVLAPALKQPFFIGDGLTSSGEVQQVIAPAGATRLFLGIMDEYAWFDNEGAFTVQVLKTSSCPPIHLALHPSANAGADAVANPANGVTTLPPKQIFLPGITPTTTPTAPGPELHAHTAIELCWPSEAGRLYQVQWTPSLNPPEWVDFGTGIPGSGANLSIFDSTRTHPQGFYRVRILPE